MRGVAGLLAACTWILTAWQYVAAEVIPLTARGFDKQVGTGKWFIEFYTDWCGHCQRLQPVFEQLAEDLHGQAKLGKVNADDNAVLSKRFRVRGYPSIYLVQGRSVWAYEGARQLEAMKAFVEGGYRKAPKLPLMASPFGPVGQLKGWLNEGGLLALEAYHQLAKTGVPGWLAAVLVVLVVVVGIVVLLGSAVYLAVPGFKTD